MSETFIYHILIIAAFIISEIAFYPCLAIAKRHNIVDHPNKRKLQDQPIPVFGGVAVATGIFIPLFFAYSYFQFMDIKYELLVMFALVIIGVYDDIYDIPAWFRLIVEISLVWFLVWKTHVQIDDLHGLLGFWEPISVYTALPLSLLAGVGIINAINLIDGVDGYSSGYGIMANTFFAIVFSHFGDYTSVILSAIAAAALIPFFLHNVFGKKSKMYIGDGGSLLIGMVMTCDVFSLLTHETSQYYIQQQNLGVVALALAILCIPVFDTLRVMIARVLRKQSPMMPDKTHLHHRYIELGFSHVGTSIAILLSNMIVILMWYISYILGCSINTQFWLVVALGIFFTCGFYYGSIWCEHRDNVIFHWLRKVGSITHFEHRGIWFSIQHWVDKF